jgi:predicted DNA-binding transcriptional regulator AlpA
MRHGKTHRRSFLKFWDVDALAAHLGVPRTWIYDRTRERGPETIPHFKLGKYVRFNPESTEFQEWLAGHQVTPIVGSDTQQTFQPAETKSSK